MVEQLTRQRRIDIGCAAWSNPDVTVEQYEAVSTAADYRSLIAHDHIKRGIATTVISE